MKKAIKLTRQRVNLTKELDLRAEFVDEMIECYDAATMARMMNISPRENDPEVFKQEALKWAKMFGDCYLHDYNKYVGN